VRGDVNSKGRSAGSSAKDRPERVSVRPAAASAAQIEHRLPFGSGAEGLCHTIPELGAMPYVQGREQGRRVVRLISASADADLKIELQAGVNKVGRQRNGNHIVLVSGEVSRFHAEVTVGDSEINVRDLGSANGTFINGQRIQEGKLEAGDTVAFSNQFAFEVQIDMKMESPGVDTMPPEVAEVEGSGSSAQAVPPEEATAGGGKRVTAPRGSQPPAQPAAVPPARQPQPIPAPRRSGQIRHTPSRGSAAVAAPVGPHLPAAASAPRGPELAGGRPHPQPAPIAPAPIAPAPIVPGASRAARRTGPPEEISAQRGLAAPPPADADAHVEEFQEPDSVEESTAIEPEDSLLEPLHPAEAADRATAREAPELAILERERRQLAVLYQVSKRCMSAETLGELDRLLINVLERVVSFQRGFITYQLPNGDWKLVMSPKGDRWDRTVVRSLLQQALKLKVPLAVAQSASDDRLGTAGPGQNDARLLLPLRSRSSPVGAIFLISNRADSFDDQTVDFLSLFADIAALAVVNCARLEAGRKPTS
jgi:pSer/pThr/pTyr-binding forkhead associated (FHA) protein